MSEIVGIGLHELLERVKKAMAVSFPHKFWIKGEISAMKENPSGHCYIDLVDKNPATGAISARGQAIIWSSTWKILRPYFEKNTGTSLCPGMNILLSAQIQYSEMYGLSMIVNDIDPSYSVGEMEQLRLKTIARLKEEGMMDMNSTLSLPSLPRRFAVISSETAAGYRDFIKHLKGNPFGFYFSTTLFPAPMQGTDAPAGIISALDAVAAEMDARGAKYDAALILRGGGSVTDLSCFDDYDLAVHVAQFPIPVMVAVGHDQDYHVADMVACVSVKTPTALADYLVGVLEDLDAELSSIAARLSLALSNKYRASYLLVENITGRLLSGVRHRFAAERGKVDLLEQRVQKGNPLHILSSGYSLVRREGKMTDSVTEMKEGDLLEVIMKDGFVRCTVDEIHKQ